MDQLIRLALAFWLAACASMAVAQVPPEVEAPPPSEPVLWNAQVFGPEGPQFAPSYEEACRLNHKSWNPGATYQPPEYDGVSNFAKCNWIARQYGGPEGSNTVLPHGVNRTCAQNSREMIYGWCTPNGIYSPPCEDCESASVTTPRSPTVGNPISISSGQKLEHVTDYASADGLLKIQRFYHSNPMYGRTPPPGFGPLWHGLIPGRLELSIWSDGRAMDLYLDSENGFYDRFQSSEDWDSWSYQSTDRSRRKLIFLGDPATKRTNFLANAPSNPNGPAEIQITNADGTKVGYRRVDRVGYKRNLVPVEKLYPGGYKQQFLYGSDQNYPDKIVDSFGRELLLTWKPTGEKIGGQYNYFGTSVIASIVLPDGKTLQYIYDTPSVAREYYSGATHGTGPEPLTAPVELRDDRLVGVRLRNAEAVVGGEDYLYEDGRFPYALTGRVDFGGQRLGTYTYNHTGLAASTEGPGGIAKYQINHYIPSGVYNSGSGQTRLNTIWRTVENPLGLVEEYTLNIERRSYDGPFRSPYQVKSKFTRSHDPSIAGLETFDYDWERLTRYTDKSGTIYRWDIDSASGRPLVTLRGAGRLEEQRTTALWEHSLDVPTQTVEDGLTKTIVRSADGLPTSIGLQDTSNITIPYSTLGLTRTTNIAYDTFGRVVKIDGPLSATANSPDDVSTYTYVGANMTMMTNALGQQFVFEGHDANGLPSQITDPNGIKTMLRYDDRRRVIGATIKDPYGSVSNDQLFALGYDNADRLTSLSVANAAPTLFNYNAIGWLMSVVAPSGERIDFTHDPMGNVLTRTTRRSNGTATRTITQTFDQLGRLLTRTLGTNRTTSYAYDKVGNVIRETNARGFAVQNALDPLKRLVSQVIPAGGVPETTYDKRDNVKSVKDGIGVTTSYVRNGFGEVIQETSPDRGTTVRYYDSAGNVTAVIDGRGQRVDHTYDVLGRVLTATPQGRPASETVTYTYDINAMPGSFGKGRLARIVTNGTTVEFKYDHRGNVLTKRQRNTPTASWLSLSYFYDTADRITSIIYPSQRNVIYSYDANGRPTTVRWRQTISSTAVYPLASAMTYMPFGPLERATFGNGLRVVNDWGTEGRLLSRRLERVSNNVAVSALSYGYDNNDNVTSITDLVTPAKSQTFAYDEQDRLVRVTANGGLGQRDDFVYDANGNRLRTEQRVDPAAATPDSSASYALTAGTNRLATISDATSTRSFAHDGRGNLTQDAKTGQTSVMVDYDGHGRLTSYTVGADRQTMLYNGEEERIAVATGPTGMAPSDSRVLMYDLDHRLVGEYGPGGASDIRAEYVWMTPAVDTLEKAGSEDMAGGYQPLAMFAPGSGGGPLQTWFVHGNHLGVPIATTDASGNAGTPALTVVTGFPGQWKNAVTLAGADYYSNRYRDYDPTTGRYLQADPIGLNGGSNLYLYAGGNPVNTIDPLGLRSATVADVGGFAFEWWLKRQARPARATPWGRAIGVGEAVGAAAAVAKFCYDHANGDDPDEDGPCEIQKREDELECNQWHITGGGAGLTRQQGYAVCMRTVMVRYGECRSRGMNPGRVTTPLFLPTGRRGGPDRSRFRR